jgi:tRNA pseudouridine55 synthase
MTNPQTRPSGGPRRRKDLPPDPFHGVLLVDKSTGMTSHDVVHKIRKHFDLRKVGHGGTLDPNATGLLPILIGRGTKISDKVMSSDKEYEGRMHLGIRTDSQDVEGKVLSERPWDTITEQQVRDLLIRYTGEQQQIPPMVSAVKKDGVPLYKLARKGQEIEREPRTITIHAFELLAFSPPFIDFRIRCTKGTYVRTLCDDIGEDLGCGAHLAALRRTETGGCQVREAFPLEEILGWERETLDANVVPLRKFARDPLG